MLYVPLAVEGVDLIVGRDVVPVPMDDSGRRGRSGGSSSGQSINASLAGETYSGTPKISCTFVERIVPT